MSLEDVEGLSRDCHRSELAYTATRVGLSDRSELRTRSRQENPVLSNRFLCPFRMASMVADTTHPGYQESVDQHRGYWDAPNLMRIGKKNIWC